MSPSVVGMALDPNHIEHHLTLTGEVLNLLTAASQRASDAGVRFPKWSDFPSPKEQIGSDASKAAIEGELKRLGLATLSAVNDLKAIVFTGFAVLAIAIAALQHSTNSTATALAALQRSTDTFANATTATLEQLTYDARVRWVRQLEAKMDEMPRGKETYLAIKITAPDSFPLEASDFECMSSERKPRTKQVISLDYSHGRVRRRWDLSVRGGLMQRDPTHFDFYVDARDGETGVVIGIATITFSKCLEPFEASPLYAS
jgi:hypothetical protein